MQVKERVKRKDVIKQILPADGDWAALMLRESGRYELVPIVCWGLCCKRDDERDTWVEAIARLDCELGFIEHDHEFHQHVRLSDEASMKETWTAWAKVDAPGPRVDTVQPTGRR